jgi:hypothetical protein
VFLSLDVGTFFALDAVTLKVDDKEVANYLYTEREVEALASRRAEALLGNLKAGEHETGRGVHRQGPHERDMAGTTQVRARRGRQHVELRITDAMRPRCNRSSPSVSGMSGRQAA